MKDYTYRENIDDRYGNTIGCKKIIVPKNVVNQIRADAIDEFAHSLKETFNNEYPSNYHCTKPYFTLDNVRVLVDLVAKEQKND